ncbi:MULTISPECIES: fused MFS/spermidine synthase [Ramlibacter]|uniref:Spermidine synthase n=1 Tax=Ramlibacter pinisoli TaxID=2682844 RepID=A0A6N8IYH8_9BURK|nr:MULTISPECIES: fused MFS/spermidine synthase [Ramlibacter]MBA2961729.1 fused MFS/spermidine synthase [Ramlibacter sp. CGMCC 1.13660]MVQ31672.1 spermidine synthase [Ramlibacter pinisoli]
MDRSSVLHESAAAAPSPSFSGHAATAGLALPALLLVLSGACGLAWQLVWTAGFGIALGHELVAVLAVLGAFFGGLAGGAWALAARIERSTRPALWYAALEAATGLWGLAVVLLAPSLLGALARWIGPQPAAWVHGATALVVPLVLLLPATLAMGATLPALERQLRGSGLPVLPALYAANTAGALVGLLLAVFVSLPGAGLRATAIGCALANVACTLLALLLWGRTRIAVPSAPAPTRFVLGRTGWRLLLTGLLGIGHEVLALRVLAQVCENTVYTYAVLLATFLLGTAAGAALWRRAGVPSQAWPERIDRLLLGVAVAVLAGGLALFGADRLATLPVAWFGPGFGPALLGEALAGAAAMLLPALAMGALFSALCQQAQAEGWPLGRAIGLNTLGAALAPVLVGAWLAPLLGARLVLALLVAGYMALCSARSWQRPRGAVVVAVAAAVALVGPPLRFIDVPEGGRVLFEHDGAMAAVSVVADADDVARLHINNRVQEGSTAGGVVEVRLAQIPLMLHGGPERALFLGLGTGYTAHAAALDPRVHVRAVELLPDVVRASQLFMLRPAAPRAAHPVDIVAADARRWVQADDARYDVVVADLFHPARSGAGNLYTVEHFRAVRERLAPGGLFCQWLALHQMDVTTLRSIVAAFLQVYPDAIAVLASNGLDSPVVGLVGRPDRPVWRVQDVAERPAAPAPALGAALRLAHLDGRYAVLGSVLADAAGLRRLAGDAPANTDDLPVVAHRAARTDYAPEAAPRERLQALLQILPPVPAGVLAAADPERERLAAYWRARSRYLALGAQVRPDPDPRVMLDRLAPPLVELLTASPEFQPAADALEGIARSLQADNYPLSQQVLARVRELQGSAAPAAVPAPEQNPIPSHP